MLKIWRFIIKNKHEIRQYSLVFLTVLFISFLFPNTARFKYEFAQGQVWRYETLGAPFDYPILKSKEELLTQEQTIRDHAEPYFTRDTSVKSTCIESFREAFTNMREDKSYTILSTGQKIINELYDLGILADEDSSYVGDERQVHVSTGNQISNERPLTLSEAYTKIRHDLSASGFALSSPLHSMLEEVIEPDIRFNPELTEKFIRQEINALLTTQGIVRKGETIVSQNEIITHNTYQRLLSYRLMFNEEIAGTRSPIFIYAGYILLTLLVVVIFLTYLQFHKRDVFMSTSKLLFMLMWVVTYVFLVYAVEKNDTLNSFLVPFCILPIVIKTFYNERLALNTLIAVILLTSFMTNLNYEFICLNLIAGIVAILTNNVTRYWSRFFGSIGLIFLAYATGYLGISLIREGGFINFNWSVYGWLTLNAVLTLLAYPLIPLLERIFGFTSSIRLAELGDLNRPLLRELSLKAPGTLQHSLQVGNLAEAAAEAIHGDPLLVRVAALYHDVGKIDNPGYFIENQRGENPHTKLPEMDSARLIIDHIPKGIALAKKYRLPEILIDFIKTHHGTTRVEYFFRTHQEKNPTDSGSENSFRYPGPKPWSKEQSVLMLADSIEAASRSVTNPSEKNLDLLVDDIISQKIKNGQLEDANLSFSQLEVCRKVFKKVINSMYHGRVEYPEANAVISTVERN